MSIDQVWKKMALAAIGCAVLVACGETGGEAVIADDAGDANAAVEAPQVAGLPAEAEPATVADIFPEGPGREVVLANCASCHAVACAAIGQRPVNRWQELAEAHSEHVPSLSDEQREAAFAYLAENFGADDPEPNVPPAFLERGCTPF